MTQKMGSDVSCCFSVLCRTGSTLRKLAELARTDLESRWRLTDASAVNLLPHFTSGPSHVPEICCGHSLGPAGSYMREANTQIQSIYELYSTWLPHSEELFEPSCPRLLPYNSENLLSFLETTLSAVLSAKRRPLSMFYCSVR